MRALAAGGAVIELWDEFRALFTRLRVLIRLEQPLLRFLLAYGLAIGFLSLVIPLTVQELVNTFAYTIRPVMIVTLAMIMAVILLVVGGLRVLQHYAVEMLERRVFARMALAVTDFLPAVALRSFKPDRANRFLEAVLMQRALSVVLVDGVNVAVGGAVGMLILALYHPYFILFNTALLGGFLLVIVLGGIGGLETTLAMSQAKYETLAWIQKIANHLIHFKVADCRSALLVKTDELVREYVEARQARFAVLLRQSLASLGWQAVGHSGLIAFAGWLLAVGEITLGQFVAAEVIVGSLLLNLDTVVRRISHVFYLMTSVVELDDLFSQAKDVEPGRQCVPLPDPRDRGIHILCREVAFAHPDCAPVLEHFSIELRPGDKVGILARTSSEQNAIARVLAGVYRPTQGIVRYNSVDIWDLDPEDLHGVIGVVLNYHPSLFDGTLEDNISMGRSGVRYQDLHWALNLVELEEEIAALPLALRTPVSFESEAFTDSLMQRVLVARAVVTHPHVLLLEGSLPSIPQELRGRILRRLCANEESWTVVYVSCDPSFLIEAHARRVLAA